MEFQRQLIEKLRNSISPKINLAEELADFLDISADSAYRRLRCETAFTIDEAIAISDHYNLPDLMGGSLNAKTVSFRMNLLSNDENSFSDYLRVLFTDIQWIRQKDNAIINYAAEDIPIFYHFFFPSLARFKMMYWNKSILGNELFRNLTFEDIKLPSTWQEEIPHLQKIYLETNANEIWHLDSIKSTLKQIEFYYKAQYFQSKESVIDILDQLDNLVDWVKKMADTGKRFNVKTNQQLESEINYYISDVMIGTNSVLINNTENSAAYISYNTFNFIQTQNHDFNESTQKWMNQLKAQSTLISKVSEAKRNVFISSLRSQINKLRMSLNP